LNGVGGCTGCHSLIDGIGYTFEEFDGLGRYRSTENGQAVDDSGKITLGSDIDGPVPGTTSGVLDGAAELSNKMLGSKQVLGCFIRQMYRYAMGQVETPTTSDSLTVIQAGNMSAGMSPFTADSKMTQAFLALIAEPAFVLRTTLQ